MSVSGSVRVGWGGGSKEIESSCFFLGICRQSSRKFLYETEKVFDHEIGKLPLALRRAVHCCTWFKVVVSAVKSASTETDRS